MFNSYSIHAKLTKIADVWPGDHPQLRVRVLLYKLLNAMNNLNFLHEELTENWIEHFIDRNKFTAFLNGEGADSKQVAQLANQFIEQAILVEKECETLVRKEFDDEDLLYSRSKAAKLWLCAQACFASINWSLELMKECCNVISMKVLMNRLVACCYPENNITLYDDIVSTLYKTAEKIEVEKYKPEQLFVSWFFAKWLLKVDTEGRYPEVVAKATVSNPSNQFDANLVLAEQVRNCITELRSLAPTALIFLKKLVVQNCENQIILPTKECFLIGLEVNSGSAFDALGHVSSSITNPKPDFDDHLSKLNGLQWKTMISYTIMCNNFASGKIMEAKESLKTIVKNMNKQGKKRSVADVTSPLVSVNTDDLSGYCVALGVSPPKSLIDNERSVFEKKMFSAQCSEVLEVHEKCSLMRGACCQTMASTSAAALAENIFVENVVTEYCAGLLATSVTLRKLVTSDESIKHFIEAILRRKKKASSEMNQIQEVLQYLSITFSKFHERLKTSNLNIFDNQTSMCFMVNFKEVTRVPAPRVPDSAYVKGLLSGGTENWHLLTTYDINEIKTLCSKLGGKFVTPRRSKPSVMISDVITAASSQRNFDYVNMLLGKLEQLAIIGDLSQWNSLCNECVKELGALGKVQEVQMRFAFDSVRVQLDNWHSRFTRVSNNATFLRITHDLNNTVKAIINSSLSNPTVMCRMMLQIVTFFINTSEWEFLIRPSFKIKSSFLDLAKMIAAYMTSAENVAKEIAEGPWWHVLHSTFEEPNNKRRSDGSLIREQSKQLVTKDQFFDMLRLIKEYRTLSFLISFIGKLYNIAIANSTSKSVDKDTQALHEIPLKIFVEHPDYWQSVGREDDSNKLQFNTLYLTECLEILFVNAMIVNPINAFWLRSYADFQFSCEKYENAFVLYMETCVACSDSLMRLLPENVVDDLMWLKVQKCLRKMGQQTLAALICQLMKNPSDHYVATVNALLETNGETMDACTGYFPLISDINLVEFMSDVFEKLRLKKKNDILLNSISLPEINSHNYSQNERFRRRERLLLILCAYAFQIQI